MKHKAKVLKLAKEVGATVETSYGEVLVDAPAGMVWTSDGVHQLVNSPWYDDTMPMMWEQAYDRMTHGLAACPDSECDCCNE